MGKKKQIYGILNEPDIGCCPSCKKVIALPRLMELDKLQTCPICHASSYGYKWLADRGNTAARRLSRFRKKVINDETGEV